MAINPQRTSVTLFWGCFTPHISSPRRSGSVRGVLGQPGMRMETSSHEKRHHGMVQPNCQNSTKQWHFKKHIMTLTLWITIVLRHFLKLSLWNFTNPVLTTWQNVSELVIEFIEVVHGFTFQLLWNGRLSLEALKDTLPLCILCTSSLLLLLLLLSLLCQVRINNKPAQKV